MAAEEENFDLTVLKKKKKKKVVVLVDEEDLDGPRPSETATDQVEGDDGAISFGAAVEEPATGAKEEPAETDVIKKKKKTVDVDLLSEELSFGDMKKKKKKKKATEDGEASNQQTDGGAGEPVAGELEAPKVVEETAAAAGGGDAEEDFGKKKKKKSKKGTKTTDLPDDLDINLDVPEAANSAPREYQYSELLERVFDIMRAKNPDMIAGEKRRFVMKPPQVIRLGTKKSAFVNFTEICKMVHRQADHLLGFLLAELGTSGSVDGSNALVLKGRFQQKQIEHVLRKYIREYVTCHTCKSPDTILAKENRLFFLQCETCGSKCSVASIKAGFQAVTGKRAALRAKTGV